MFSPSPPRSLDPVRDSGFESVALGQRLADEFVNLQGNRASEVLIRIERAQQYKAQVPINFSCRLDEGESIELWHMDVSETKIEPLVGQHLQGVFGAEAENQLVLRCQPQP